MPEGGAPGWRDAVAQYHSRLIDEISTHVDSERRQAAEQAAEQAVAAERAQAVSGVESLNQVLRRLRAAGENQVLQLLAEGCAQYAGKLVVLVFENGQSANQARVAASAGVSGEGICFETSGAPAVVAALESRDRVTALATPGEISTPLADALGSIKAYLFPVIARHTVMAVLVASEGEMSSPSRGTDHSACALGQIELLCEVAGMRLEADPMSVMASAANPAQRAAASWESLSADDQKLHVQAQRMARVRVAEMRLNHAAGLRNGTASADIYGVLREPIDAAREQFRGAYLAKSGTMVDYLHLEILRSLAQDDERLLGVNYPGPMHV